MKILVVSPKFHPVVGGGETFVLNSLEQLHAHGEHVFIATEPLSIRNTNDYPYKVYEIPGLSDSHLDVIPCADGLFKLIQDMRPDVIHAHGYFSLIAITLANQNNIPVLASIHSTPVWGERIVGGMSGFYQEKLFAEKVIELSKPGIITAANDVYEDAAIKLSKNKHKVVYFPYPIKDMFYETHDPKEYRKLLGISGKDILITVPSRIIERKGIRESIEMLSFLPEEYKLCLPSSIRPHDKDYWSSITQSKSFNELRRRIIIPTEEILHDQMPLLYAATDIVCMPSYYEGAPVATVEAMASKKPFVGYDSQGINGFITNMRNGLLVKKKSVKPLADAVQKLVEDPGLAKRLSETAHDDVIGLSWQNQLPELMNMYESLRIN